MSRWLLTFLEPHFDSINAQVKDDQELREAFIGAAGSTENIAFSIVAATDAPFLEHAAVLRIHKAMDALEISLQSGTKNDGAFCLNAKQEHWERFFAAELVRPYQSYWGMLRILGQENVFVSDDRLSFAKCARVWRIVLDRMRLAITGQIYSNIVPDGEETEDAVTGKYIWIEHPEYGKVKMFYEYAGTDSQNLLFLHTAGSDSRQYHSLMNTPALQEKCTMFAVDLPGHGRSNLGSQQSMDTYALSEESYIESISKFLKKVGLQDPIVCGASMAGHVCIALAIRARELEIRGAIPCEGCAHLSQPAAIYDIRGNDSSIVDPEKVCGMIAPSSPEFYKRQIWWQYSTQGSGVFTGDLKFYFQGWDGRDRLQLIDTTYCSVYMLTGEYDYSCSVEASEEIANATPGAVFEAMPGLGHFPLIENPQLMLPYLLKAIDHIQNHREG